MNHQACFNKLINIHSQTPIHTYTHKHADTIYAKYLFIVDQITQIASFTVIYITRGPIIIFIATQI